jgi:hypothetical protein
MGAGRSGKDSLRWWCGFNDSVSTQEGTQQDETLPKDETETASSSWLCGKET